MLDCWVCREFVRRIWEEAGIDAKFERRSKHPSVTWVSRSGVRRWKTYAGTPSDWRSRANSWRDIRRQLLMDGDLIRPTPEEIREREMELERFRREKEEVVKQKAIARDEAIIAAAKRRLERLKAA